MRVIRPLRAAFEAAWRQRVAEPVADVDDGGGPSGDAVVDCAVYRDGVRRPGPRDPAAAIAQARRRGARGMFVWIGLFEPTESELAGVAEQFGLHPLAVEDAVHAHQRPKLERYDETLFMVLKTVRYVSHGELTSTSEVVETGEIMVFVGADFVITVRHGGHGALGALRRELEESPEQLAKGPASVLHGIADQVVDHYLDVAADVREDIDEVESAVFADTRGDASQVGRIYQLKRELLELKRAVTPLDRPLQQLSETPIGVVHPEIRSYFRDVADHLNRVSDQVNGYDALIDSILQANLAQVQATQNEDMRKITAWAAIIAVPTMVCGVYGMNFRYMPELEWRFGYPLVLTVIATASWLIHRGFRRNGWL
ncbi:magnesium and cobalt transport protein CorA [Streptomyces sedi]|uniref:Magnesium and cobalt transport protein CorA n=1 Tax=Streptomyces sedi TaxID=555059 RepID=A0A5C4UQE4_9ACTN|nr:magnesium and cobalt transport protein CorA [Streptomyces sedi]TNM25830.1 magnesium and cobalt transport protein CorA [Streptomyces sedi]